MAPTASVSASSAAGAGAAQKKDKAASLKGDEAEEVVLAYMQKMNRPFASTDVSANLHGAVSKALAQKALVGLAAKGRLVKKDYGKQTIFVYPQASLPPTSADTLAALDADLTGLQGPLDIGLKRVRALRAELAALVQEPKTADLGAINGALQADIADKQARLATLRSGAPPIPAAAIASADQAWTAERAQWVARRRTYGAVVDGLMGETVSADQRAAWEDDVGVDAEVPEVARALESSALVLAPPTTATSRLPAPAVVSAGCSSKRKTSGAGKAAGGSKKARTAGGES